MRTGSNDRTPGRVLPRAIRLGLCLGVACAFPFPSASLAAEPAKASKATPAIQQRTFDSAEKASEALILAAERYDVPAMKEILGPDGVDLVTTEDVVQSENLSKAFAAQAREKTAIEVDPLDPNVAILSVGPEDWPLPIPIVREGGKWRFDTAADARRSSSAASDGTNWTPSRCASDSSRRSRNTPSPSTTARS